MTPQVNEWVRVGLDALLTGVAAGAAVVLSGGDSRKAFLTGMVAGLAIVKARITPAPGQSK
jgi:hypothetical protein